jgi:hypothetical protein
MDETKIQDGVRTTGRENRKVLRMEGKEAWSDGGTLGEGVRKA